MAMFRLRYKCGKKALAHLSYINGEDKYISKKEHVEFIETKNLPENFKDINEFWEAAILYERSNANIYREFEITLPKEFSKEKNKEILDRFLEKTFGDKYVYNYAMHNPNSEQPHAHVMFCDRKLDGVLREKNKFFKRYNPKNPEKGGAKKDTIVKSKEYVNDLRKNWEVHLNKYLEAEGIEKVSCDTLKKQREEAIEKGELLKAEKLNREAIHINKKIKYQKIDKENIDAYDLYERIKMNEYMKDKKIRDEIDVLYKKEFIKEKYEEKKKEFNNYTFEKILEEKEKVEYDIFKLSKKMSERSLENEAINILTRGESNKNKNEKNHLFKMIKKDRANKSKYKKRINEINKTLEEFLEKNKDAIIDKKLELKAKYMRPFKFKMIEKEIVDKIFIKTLKKNYSNEPDKINLYKAYIDRKDLRDEKLNEIKKVEENKNKMKNFVEKKDYGSAKIIQNINRVLYKNIKSLDRINKKFNRDIKVQNQILKHGEFILDEYKNILSDEEMEIERE
ncbi:MobA/MobL family protein [Streptobacillus moniliformis]|uniref:MobA/MobL protein n=1 Tax=Streptobacillus moniliformis (strain ATCC 14647 / DSM 12112 / NCTC 10651 / 9901) TaxID=519441 RepID=D1AV88_STRM9|nr:MobA/MobL family protein [Streptobacillus moniliformis]ACZ01648.1 MobA/MobL protein [Streptobacillus moniliformis DSM 12112]AVL43352.1 MobA/MobL family protein [Streptobacillus moniliformis]SQA13174.1 DNA strand transferase [Streptobacillus moniliformis]